jgi:LDH2 family malate/lactate/ureidoglycolate dehydrogenase
LPGERAQAARRRALADGIALTADLLDAVTAAVKQLQQASARGPAAARGVTA